MEPIEKYSPKEEITLVRMDGEKKRRPWWQQLFLDIGYGLLIAFSILSFSLLLAKSFAIENNPYTSWIAFFLFAIILNNIKRPFLSFLFSGLCGIGFYLILLYWIFPTVYEGTKEINLAYFSVVGLSVILSLQFFLFGYFYFYVKQIKWAMPLGAACLWVSLEILHQFIALKAMAFPWFVLGYSQFEELTLIQISSITGAYGVSFLMVFLCFSLAGLIGRYGKIRKSIFLIFALSIFVMVYIFGRKNIKEQVDYIAASSQQIKVALMQPNTHQMFLDGRNEDIFYVIANQLLSLEDKGVQFIVWPESSLPGSFQEEGLNNFIKEISAKYKAPQLFGGIEDIDGTDYVSAALFDENGFSASYQKVKLVPFGEFLPFKGILNDFYKKEGITSLTGSFKEGENFGTVLNLKIDGESPKSYLFGASICFESLFPKIWREQAISDAQFFVNISNDGWFMETAAPYQHIRINVFRAVENRRPILRSTTTGISAWIDSIGKIRFQTRAHQQETAIFDFDFQMRNEKTFYTEYGDIFALICAFIALTFFIISISFLQIADYGD